MSYSFEPVSMSLNRLNVGILVLLLIVTAACNSAAVVDKDLDTTSEFSPTATLAPKPDPTPTPTEPSVETLPLGVAFAQEVLRSAGLHAEFSFTSDNSIDFWLDRGEAGQLHVGTFVERADGTYQLRVTNKSGVDYWFPIESLAINADGRFVLRNDQLQDMFVYYPELGQLRQVRESPFLSESAGMVTVHIGDGWRENSNVIVKDIHFDASAPGMTFSLGEFGRYEDLGSKERVELAAKLAVVTAARAWDSDYSLADLEAGQPFKIVLYDGSERTVSPEEGLDFYLVTTPGAGGTFGFGFDAVGRRFWWEVSARGGLSLFVSMLPSNEYLVDITGEFATVHLRINFYDALIVMLEWQYLEAGLVEPIGPYRILQRSDGIRRVFGNTLLDDYLVKLIFTTDPSLSRYDNRCRCDRGEFRRIVWEGATMYAEAVSVGGD